MARNSDTHPKPAAHASIKQFHTGATTVVATEEGYAVGVCNRMSTDEAARFNRCVAFLSTMVEKYACRMDSVSIDIQNAM